MAQIAIDLTSTTPNTEVTAYRGAETGRLKSIVASAYLTALPVGTLTVEIGCMLGGRGREFITATFFSGQVSRHRKCVWFGDYPFDPYEEIYVWAWSFGSVQIRVVGKLEVV